MTQWRVGMTQGRVGMTQGVNTTIVIPGHDPGSIFKKLLL